MPNLKRSELPEFIERTEGRFFRATFVKVDHTIRNMTCRRGVWKYVKGGENLAAKANPNLRVVYEVGKNKNQYRMINLATLLFIRYQGMIWTITEEGDNQ